VASACEGLIVSRLFVGTGDRRLALVGDFILKQGHNPSLAGPRLGYHRRDLAELGLIVGIGTMNVVAAPLVGDPQPRQQMGEPSFGGEGEPVADPKEVLQAPAGSIEAEEMGVTPHDVQEGFLSLLRLLAVRGKKRACARVPVGS
jgi:hypothetical protein